MEPLADFLEKKEHIQDGFFNKPLCCGLGNRLRVSKTGISESRQEAVAVLSRRVKIRA